MILYQAVSAQLQCLVFLFWNVESPVCTTNLPLSMIKKPCERENIPFVRKKNPHFEFTCLSLPVTWNHFPSYQRGRD